MKDKCFIYYGNPCLTYMADPALQTMEDAEARGQTACRYYPDRKECSPPDFGCIQQAGTAIARNVIQFYSEATNETLSIEREEFKKRAPLPPDKLKAYIDIPERDFQLITDPELVVQRACEYARAVLGLKAGERIFRSPEETWTQAVAADADKAAAELSKPIPTTWGYPQ